MLLTLAILSLVCALIPFGLLRANLRLYTPPPLPSAGEEIPPVSVLIPARNEESNIAAALATVRASEGVEFEVIVLDDHSTDATAEIVAAVAQKDARVRLESSPSLPPGWNGKMHACHHLASLARYSHLLFIDADVRLAPDALRRLSPLLSRADLWSGVPRQITETFSEQLLLPLIHLVLLGYLPIARMRRTLDPSLGAGCGQMMLTTADAYRKAGGHAGIRTSMHDGLQLPRLYRRASLRTDLSDFTPIATCRLYDCDAATWRGLAKNAHEGMGSWRVIFPMTFLLTLGQIVPAPLLLWCITVGSTTAGMSLACLLLASVAVVCNAWVYGQLAARFQQKPTCGLLHPVAVASLLGIQWWARLRMALRLGATWKGRTYQ